MFNSHCDSDGGNIYRHIGDTVFITRKEILSIALTR